MSVDANYVANAQRLVSQELTNTTETKIGDTAVDNSLVLANVSIVNASASSVTVSLIWYDVFDTTSRMIWKGAIPADTTQGADAMPLPIPLREGDEIRAIGNADIHINLVYVMQMTNTR